MGHFSRQLVKARLQAGFDTAYAYYHRNGGKRIFPFTYAYYAKIERGSALPRAPWLRLILAMLRITPSAKAQHELVLAYLHDQVDDEETFSQLIQPMIRPSQDPDQSQAMKSLLGANTYHLTPDEFQAMTSSPAAHWCLALLIHSRKPLTMERIQKTTGHSPLEVAAALKVLCRHGLARAYRGSRYASPLVGKYCVLPKGYPGNAADVAKLRSYLTAYSRNAPLLDMASVARLDPSAVRTVAAAMAQAVETASPHTIREDGFDSSLCVIEARIRPVFAF